MNIAHLFTALKNHGVVDVSDDSRVELKAYQRMQCIELPNITSQHTLDTAYNNRRSIEHDEDIKNEFTLEDISILLSGVRILPTHHRPYPSGGGLYPIETYLYTNSVGSLSDGYHHYNPKKHALEFLWEAQPPYKHGWTPRIDIVFTATWNRQLPKYHMRTLPLVLIEVGHLAQNILLAGATKKIFFRPWFGFNAPSIEQALELEAGTESVVYVLRSLP